MSEFDTQRDMLILVAQALGLELRQQVTFVGGCTTGLLLTDAFIREQVRSTDDVDLIVSVIGYPAFARLQQQLSERGFRLSTQTEDSDDDFPICAMTLGQLRVDFIPDDEEVLGFSNRWYREAVASSTPFELKPDLIINLVNPVYFIATKLEAYRGRGRGDALASRDIEDILNLVDGRPEVLAEVDEAPAPVRQYIAEQLGALLQDANFEYAINSHAAGSQDRENLMFERLETLAGERP